MVSDLRNEESKKGPWLSGHIGSLFKAQTLRQCMVVVGGRSGYIYPPSSLKMRIDDNKDNCERVLETGSQLGARGCKCHSDSPASRRGALPFQDRSR